jgi:hypothetical protein
MLNIAAKKNIYCCYSFQRFYLIYRDFNPLLVFFRKVFIILSRNKNIKYLEVNL